VLLQAAIISRDPERIRAVLGRWIAALLIWQVLVLAACGVYIAILAPGRPAGLAWAAPPVAAVLGSALGLQWAVIALFRANRSA